MPWWGKSSSKETKKKEQKESFIESIYQRIRSSPSERENCVPERHSRKSSDSVAKRGSASRGLSISPSPSTRISRHQSFVERPEAQPLPLPQEHRSTVFCTKSDTSKPAKQGVDSSLRPLLFPRPQKCGCTASTADTLDAEVELSIASDSSDISIRSDPADFLLLSPLASENNRRNKTPIHTPHCSKKIDYNQKSRPFSLVPDDQILSTSPKEKILSSYVQVLQVPHHGAPCGAPDSSKSSPSWSATRAASPDQNTSSIFAAIKSYKDTDSFGPGQCSTANYLPGADLSGRLFQQQHRCSPECSPVPSPRVRSPGPCSRIQSGAVTPLHSLSPGPSSIIHSRCSPECSPLPSPRMASPSPSSRIQSGTLTPPYLLSPGPSSRTHSSAVNPLHPRGGKTPTEASELWPDDGRQKGHPLPLPPIIIPSSQFSPSCSATATPSRSPSRVEYPTCSVSRWKKGRLLGSGSYGHVYLAFNRETGEICAMKEVTVLSDDTKSKECTEQMRQEIVLLSRLQHPNIVKYLGSEMIDDRFCIYLEYVSGGSIYKLLQDYGPFGESAIRNYTQQILSGLAYLHAKNTVHRDIKGANILVDPTGRVKLADFGMAKHITGQACPLSLKGTPNWMAPEVIKNSNGCNLAVDIWSLGCTVLEMATAKPPWSHYGGVAALFKIGYSRELPVIPDDLSNEGKEFVMLCLQRNPFDRPTAAQLLMHRFVKNASPFDMTIAGAETTQLPYAVQALGIGQCRNASSLESEGIVLRQARGSGIGPAYSEAQTPRNESFPISPVGSPLLHSRSPRYRIPMMSSPISSPHAVSGSSTPLSGSGDTILPTYYSPDNTGLQWSQTCAYMNDGTFYEKSKTSQGDIYEQSVLADQVSQKLLGDRDKLKPPQSCITLA